MVGKVTLLNLMAAASLASLCAPVGPCAPTAVLRPASHLAPCPSVREATRQALSVDGKADVGVLVVEQPGHGHRLVALA